MVGGSREPLPDLIQEVLDAGSEFEFFQAVRLIERAVRELDRNGKSDEVGGDRGAEREPVRFHALASLSFPPGQVSSVAEPASGNLAETSLSESRGLRTPIEMTIPFFGLTGPGGALPAHYTSLVIERCHLRHKDYALREFLDLFNHRLISLFYRAWEKYRFCFAYERQADAARMEEDLFTECLYSLVGLSGPGLKRRFSFDDHAFVFYGGLFAQQTRNAAALQQLLTDYIGCRATIREFVGQWLYLPEDMQSGMPDHEFPFGRNLALGVDTVAGSQVWDVQSRFRVTLGPLSWSRFRELLPGTPRLQSLTELIRFYVGVRLDFEVQLILVAKDIPSCRMESSADYEPRLGWTTWVGDPPPGAADADDAVFVFRLDSA